VLPNRKSKMSNITKPLKSVFLLVVPNSDVVLESQVVSEGYFRRKMGFTVFYFATKFFFQICSTLSVSSFLFLAAPSILRALLLGNTLTNFLNWDSLRLRLDLQIIWNFTAFDSKVVKTEVLEHRLG